MYTILKVLCAGVYFFVVLLIVECYVDWLAGRGKTVNKKRVVVSANCTYMSVRKCSNLTCCLEVRCFIMPSDPLLYNSSVPVLTCINLVI